MSFLNPAGSKRFPESLDYITSPLAPFINITEYFSADAPEAPHNIKSNKKNSSYIKHMLDFFLFSHIIKVQINKILVKY